VNVSKLVWAVGVAVFALAAIAAVAVALALPLGYDSRAYWLAAQHLQSGERVYALPDATLGHFVHIPWPQPDYWRVLPEPMIDELRRAIATEPTVDAAYPLVMAAGLRTRWTANTIQRDPAWRKGKGPHCALNLSPADATALGIRDGDTVRVATNRGALTLPAQVDRKLMQGHVWMPNGFGMLSADGVLQGGNQNELTDVADRDPFTGIPHHRYVRCRVERVAE